MSHTPGPWSWNLSIRGYCLVVTAGELIVADFSSGKMDGDASDRYPSPETALANAHLIAAAPELLEALESAIEVMEEDLESIIDSNTVPNEDGPPDMATLSNEAKPYVEELTAELESARKAVAKAKGGAR